MVSSAVSAVNLSRIRTISDWMARDFSGLSGQGIGIRHSFTFESEIAGYAEPLWFSSTCFLKSEVEIQCKIHLGKTWSCFARKIQYPVLATSPAYSLSIKQNRCCVGRVVAKITSFSSTSFWALLGALFFVISVVSVIFFVAISTEVKSIYL